MFVGQEVQGSSFTHGVKELMFGRSQSLISDCRSIKKVKHGNSIACITKHLIWELPCFREFVRTSDSNNEKIKSELTFIFIFLPQIPDYYGR